MSARAKEKHDICHCASFFALISACFPGTWSKMRSLDDGTIKSRTIPRMWMLVSRCGPECAPEVSATPSAHGPCQNQLFARKQTRSQLVNYQRPLSFVIISSPPSTQITRRSCRRQDCTNQTVQVELKERFEPPRRPRPRISCATATDLSNLLSFRRLVTWPTCRPTSAQLFPRDY